MYKEFSPETLGASQEKSPTAKEVFDTLSLDQQSEIDKMLNKAGLPADIENLFEMYNEDNPGKEGELVSTLEAVRVRMVGTEDFRSKAQELIDLIK